MTPPKFAHNDIIPPQFWAHAHWSALAYVSSVIQDCGSFQIGSDPCMHSNRRNTRVMREECPLPKRSRHTTFRSLLSTGISGTQLNDGQVVAGHDDWDCLGDMANIGLFTSHPEDLQPGVCLNLSEKGSLWAHALVAHKFAGGTNSNFSSESCPAMPESLPKEREYFDWMNTTFDISKIREDVGTGRLKPEKEQFDAEFIKGYAEQALGMRLAKRDTPHGGTIFMAARSEHALSLPDEVLQEPVVCVFYKKGKGVLNLKGSLDYLLCDGNHRMARAYFDGKTSIDVLILSPAQSRKYRK